MPRLRCLWVRSFSACRCHFWSSRQNTEMFVQSQKQDQKERVVCFPSLLSSNLSSTCVSKFKSPTRIATAAESTQPQCVYTCSTHQALWGSLQPWFHCTQPQYPSYYPSYIRVYIYISIHTYTHTLIYILYLHIYASMSLSVLHSESRGLWKVLQVSWP